VVGWDASYPLSAEQYHCTKCNCESTYFDDAEEHKRIQIQQFGLPIRYSVCIDPECYCHTGAGKPVRILHRRKELRELNARS
jgi:hypothetical protein